MNVSNLSKIMKYPNDIYFNLFNEAYHVGSQAKKGPNNQTEHKIRLDMKQGNSVFPSETASSKRKSNFYKNVILSINSHIGRMQFDRDHKNRTGDQKKFDKQMNYLSKRLSSRNSSLFSKGNNFLDGSYQLAHEFDNTAYGKLMRQISKDINIAIPTGGGGKPNTVDTYPFNKILRDEDIDYDKLLSDDTKKELLKFEKDLRMTKKYHKPESVPMSSKQQAESISNTINNQTSQEEKQQENITNMTEKIKQQAEVAPKSWIGEKIRALRNLYSEWLEKKNKEYDQGKIGFLNGILRIIANCIDWLLEKLQNFAG